MSTYTLTPAIIQLQSYSHTLQNAITGPAPNAIQSPEIFSAAIIHEIRNPLSNILLATEMLKATHPNAGQEIYIDIILRNVLRVNGMVTDLLTSPKLAEPAGEKYFIHQLLDEVLINTEDKLMLKNIAVIKNYTLADSKIAGSKHTMKIALTNIIINAIDAMSALKGELKLITKSINGRFIIQIADNGIGISKENLKNIFKPYFTNRINGIGLGLSSTLEILLLNHVEIAVHSIVAKGTIFTLSFNRQ